MGAGRFTVCFLLEILAHMGRGRGNSRTEAEISPYREGAVGGAREGRENQLCDDNLDSDSSKRELSARNQKPLSMGRGGEVTGG